MDFKVLFPGGYRVGDIVNDDADVNFILENGEVYYCWIFIIAKVQSLLRKGPEPYFWATDMIIVTDLTKPTIRETIKQLIESMYYLNACTRIGIIGTGHHDYYANFEEVEDMCL